MDTPNPATPTPPPEPSPRPWRTPHPGEIEDANGYILYNLRYCIGGGVDEANAALIVDAVNYYRPDLHCDWRELTPEDAVAHCREVATRLGDTPCARDHLQLAAWIEDRDRLRDLVRRMLEKLAIMTAGYRCMLQSAPDADMADLCLRTEAIIRDARAALAVEEPRHA